MTLSRAGLIARLTRLYPFLSGCTFPNHPLFRKFAAPSPCARWTRVDGGEVLARLDDFVGRCAYFVGDVDRKVSAVFDRTVRPGDTVLDIGANIGVATLRLARLVGPEGRVYSFEPNPELARVLEETVARNAVANIAVHPVALADAPGRVTLRVPFENAGMGSIIEDRNEAFLAEYSIEAVTLDSYLDRLAPVRLIKIDVEGAEAAVLSGAAGLIARDRPAVILFELNDARARRDQAQSISALLSAHDYEIFGLRRTLLRLTLDETALDGAAAHVAHDYVAIARGPEFEAICARLNVRRR